MVKNIIVIKRIANFAQKNVNINTTIFYMIAIFASNAPVEDCAEEDTVVFENKKFYFVRVDKMMAGGYLQYYSAVLREVESEEEDVFG